MEINELIVGGIGLISTITSGWVSWFFARKKYNSEVDSNVIQNMQESLEFYTKLSDDNKNRLEEALAKNHKLEEEVQALKRQLFELMTSICTDLTCELRKKEYMSKIENYEEEDA